VATALLVASLTSDPGTSYLGRLSFFHQLILKPYSKAAHIIGGG